MLLLDMEEGVGNGGVLPQDEQRRPRGVISLHFRHQGLQEGKRLAYQWALVISHLDILVATFFQLTANGGLGEHGTPALKDVMGACRPQPGLLLNRPRMEGVSVLGNQ